MDKKKAINKIAENPLDKICSAMESVVELNMEIKVKHLMVISISLANFAANKECDNPDEANFIRDALDEVIIKKLTDSLEVD